MSNAVRDRKGAFSLCDRMPHVRSLIRVFRGLTAVVVVFAAMDSRAGVLEGAWLKGTTDKSPIDYRPGEEITFTVMPQGIDGEVPLGEYFLSWKRSDDFGQVETGKVSFTGAPFVYKTKLEEAGFVRLEVYVVDKAGRRYQKKYMGETTTPEGRKAMNAFEQRKQAVFFDGGAGVNINALVQSDEPKDFDDFWTRQFARLDRVPIKVDMIEKESPDPTLRLFAVRIDCAGLRPVTGYLSRPKAVDSGATFPCRLETHGYNGDSCIHSKAALYPLRRSEVVLNINAHGLKLPEFGATDADTKALRWDVRSNGHIYAFDAKQNEDPEVAYFNGMVLRVKRALQYLKTVKGWNGKDLIASGNSQGGLQTIWAAGCGEGLTRAESRVTWCCDMHTNSTRKKRNMAGDGWYVPWTESMGYYDAVNWAKRIPTSCRTIITRAGLGDYCCPPMGLAKLWNGIPGNKEICWVQGSEHGYVPPQYEGRDFKQVSK